MKFDLKGIKNIIFDLGAVVLNIDYNLTVEAFKKLDIPRFQEQYAKGGQQELFDRFEKGEISAADFRRELKTVLGKEISDAQLDTAWNAMLLDLPAERIRLLTRLKPLYRTFLLSNTNEIHIHQIYGYLNQTYQIPNFEPLFDRVYLSYQLGMRKPDAEIFNRVLEENRLVKEETLFIDDSFQHIESARKLGIPSFHLVSPDTIIDLFGQPLSH